MSTDLRRKAFRRANLRTFVQGWLGNDDYHGRFDVEGMVAEMERRDVDTDEMTNTEFWDIATRHEFDDKGVTDAMLAAALEGSHSGWVAIIRRSDGDIQQLSVNLGAADETPESVERRLRDVVRFPEGTVISIFPLVG